MCILNNHQTVQQIMHIHIMRTHRKRGDGRSRVQKYGVLTFFFLLFPPISLLILHIYLFLFFIHLLFILLGELKEASIVRVGQGVLPTPALDPPLPAFLQCVFAYCSDTVCLISYFALLTGIVKVIHGPSQIFVITSHFLYQLECM